MSQTDLPAEIGILLYPNVQLAAVYGLTDLFNLANRFATARQSSGSPALRVSHWRGEEVSAAVERVFDTAPGTPPGSPTVLILPPSFGEPMTSEEAAPLARWLCERHAEGTTLSSVCIGAFLLAETGLLAHRMATTHWACAELLAQRFPEVRVDTDKLIIDDGDVITAGGLMAWTDLGLKLVDRLLGSTIMLETARYLLADPPGRQQRCYSSFSPRLNHGDEQILKVQHWLHASGAREVTLAAMAERARLEERTFLRRFRKATGLRPTEYCQHLRVAKAREMLEFSNRTVEQTAVAAGYEDTGAFRKVFQKITGLSPGDYRSRFGLSGRT
ncbi:transcriptional regulator GlxA family with amidase domain [Rhizobium tibeticum]|uniref:GlxA family transcriptional regulator n=1 Tax=Rhizobium tibeticum TaxID=501024 RepID=UPI0027864B2B|nr:GlxA family transcriptional regulator [Rhizobium tibeticum]MDP9807547.1 transcriptional regulator GlxA family with amidase domain [Rhizobium tibeticum]